MTTFYDTNALLELLDDAFNEFFLVSDVTLKEIENIKTSSRKDNDVKYRARKLAHLLKDNPNKYDVICEDHDIDKILDDKNLECTPDNVIVASAYHVHNTRDYVTFVTNDICCLNIASRIFGLNVKTLEKTDNDYTGYKEIVMDEEAMAFFYSHLAQNLYDLLVNQYIIIKNENGDVVDKMKWDGIEYRNAKFDYLKSSLFGIIRPYNGDVYQQCALNSLFTNQVTMIKGKAGTGKSYLSLGFLFDQLEKEKIDKIIIFTNTQPTINSARLGFYPGTRTEKQLESGIGNMLSSKLGGTYVVEQLIEDGRLLLLPMCDIRGYDTSNMKAGVYITEAQNLDISLMKLALQRIGDDSICIIDGDYETQVDMAQYAGSNNGMRRMSEVFRGQDFYGEVELQNIYRGKIAEIAEDM
jgi:predicted ribonuclease YlaK